MLNIINLHASIHASVYVFLIDFGCRGATAEIHFEFNWNTQWESNLKVSV